MVLGFFSEGGTLRYVRLKEAVGRHTVPLTSRDRMRRGSHVVASRRIFETVVLSKAVALDTECFLSMEAGGSMDDIASSQSPLGEHPAFVGHGPVCALSVTPLTSVRILSPRLGFFRDVPHVRP